MLKYLLQADGLVAAALENSVRKFAHANELDKHVVLDFGCGTMPYRPIFTSAGARYIGADIDGAPDLRIEADQPLPLTNESMNFVVSFQVLEHVREVPRYLEETRRVLTRDGRLFLSTHGVWPYHPHPTDYWRWTQDGLRETLEQAGFVILRITPLCGPAAWLAMFPMLAAKKLLGPASVLLAPANFLVNVLALTADCLTPNTIRDTNAAVYAVEAERCR
ncbi:class I SAM-dependent methyltransferase [Thermomonas carbonis]|uniref:Class I SAM-dependent methyltransferase n=1 Tax=Thermomonas carbonis TaxID=1463158 RepID=A0A7G9SLJ1_9GAMM|nr:class I SAM-dependent methyltransferase [Thermomonas carbonis]QNN68716.1 class I SAM-dependent methyltransferase [Thermomonas carbonis]GHC09306.1 hypothetical protein GCM10010080_25570 [Thermomonas carbonis]